MKMGTMKRIIWLALVMALTVSVALADEQDLRQYAEDSLTEVYGYLEEELRDFVFETRQDGSLAFWPKAHPGWIYTVFRGAYGQMDGTTPFHTGYTGYCGENAVRDLLRTMKEKGWISEWSEENKAALLDACLENNVRISTEMYLAETAAQGLQGFFESCYGPTAGWTDALFELRDSVFAEYGLTPEEIPFHMPGVRSFSRRRDHQKEVLRTYTLFDGGTYPDELKDFSDSYIAPYLYRQTGNMGIITSKPDNPTDDTSNMDFLSLPFSVSVNGHVICTTVSELYDNQFFRNFNDVLRMESKQ